MPLFTISSPESTNPDTSEAIPEQAASSRLKSPAVYLLAFIATFAVAVPCFVVMHRQKVAAEWSHQPMTFEGVPDDDADFAIVSPVNAPAVGTPTAVPVAPSGPAAVEKPKRGVLASVAAPVKKVGVPAVKRAPLSEEALQDQLARLPEVELKQLDELRRREVEYARSGIRTMRNPNFESEITRLQKDLLKQAARAGLPIKTRSTTLSAQTAEVLGKATLDLHGAQRMRRMPEGMRSALADSESISGFLLSANVPPTPAAFFKFVQRTKLSSPEELRALFALWRRHQIEEKYDVVPALVQVLQSEDQEYRSLLVEELAQIRGKAATVALAQRALYDTSPFVREAAIEALKPRSAADYRDLVLAGFRYPWAPVADHATDLLVSIGDREAVPRLIDLLDQNDPNEPYVDPETNQTMVREVVKINHLRNCCLCHAANFEFSEPINARLHVDSRTGVSIKWQNSSRSRKPSQSDLPATWVAGRIAVPGEKIPVRYYGDPEGAFIRGDTTYLREDFSTSQYVPQAEPWPSEQRFDYVVRVRPVKPGAAARPATDASYPQRDAVLFALRRLTGVEGGATSESWRQVASGK